MLSNAVHPSLPYLCYNGEKDSAYTHSLFEAIPSNSARKDVLATLFQVLDYEASTLGPFAPSYHGTPGWKDTVARWVKESHLLKTPLYVRDIMRLLELHRDPLPERDWFTYDIGPIQKEEEKMLDFFHSKRAQLQSILEDDQERFRMISWIHKYTGGLVSLRGIPRKEGTPFVVKPKLLEAKVQKAWEGLRTTNPLFYASLNSIPDSYLTQVGNLLVLSFPYECTVPIGYLRYTKAPRKGSPRLSKYFNFAPPILKETTVSKNYFLRIGRSLGESMSYWSPVIEEIEGGWEFPFDVRVYHPLGRFSLDVFWTLDVFWPLPQKRVENLKPYFRFLYSSHSPLSYFSVRVLLDTLTDLSRLIPVPYSWEEMASLIEKETNVNLRPQLEQIWPASSLSI